MNSLNWWQAFPLLHTLPPHALGALTPHVHTHTQPKGSQVFAMGTPVGGVLAMVSGWLKCTRLTPDGTEAVLDVLGPGQLVGVLDLLTTGLHSAHGWVAEDAQWLYIPGPALSYQLHQNPQAAFTLLQSTARKVAELEQDLAARSLQKAPERLACFVLRLLPAGTACHGPVTLDLPYDKSLLAARLAMQPETFSRALATLKEELSITSQGHRLHIPAIQEVRQYIGHACTGHTFCTWQCSLTTTSHTYS